MNRTVASRSLSLGAAILSLTLGACNFSKISESLSSIVPGPNSETPSVRSETPIEFPEGETLNDTGKVLFKELNKKQFWQPMSDAGAPPARFNHSTGWTGSDYWVYGGTVSGPDLLGDGYLYNLNTQAWKKMSDLGAPSPRSSPVTAWTGSKILVWGGAGAGTPVSDGGLYDPATDSWEPIESSNAHLFYWGANSAWTGSELVVWGGWGTQSGPTNQGAVYHLDSNSWSPIAAAPILGRDASCSVWTGSELFIFGGRTTQSFTSNDGALYNPESNSWELLPELNAPSSRNSANCVLMSKDRILVWGGTNPDDSTNDDGKIYHLVDKKWTDVDTNNAPSARNQSKLVWTGSFAILWAGGLNGANGNQALKSGYFFFSDANQGAGAWVPMPLQGAPTATKGQADGVWTGKEFVTWGGYVHYPQSSADGGVFSMISLTEVDGAFRWSDLSTEKNCRAYHLIASNLGMQFGSAAYWVKPDPDAEAFRARCDMESDGGGWTLVVSINPGDRSHMNTSAVNDQAIYQSNAFGKFSDEVIRKLRSEEEIGFRLTVSSFHGVISAYFPGSCEFSANSIGANCDRGTYTYSGSPNFNLGVWQGHNMGMSLEPISNPYVPGEIYGTVYVHPNESWNTGAHAAKAAGGYWGNPGSLWVK